MAIGKSWALVLLSGVCKVLESLGKELMRNVGGTEIK